MRTLTGEIYLIKDDKGVPVGIPFIWKTYKLEPDEIQYFAPDEKHNYLKV
jgi:hypothetical protein